MTAPDVVLINDKGDLCNDTSRTWGAPGLLPLTTPPAGQPLVHRPGCWMSECPGLDDLAEDCECTAPLRWLQQQQRQQRDH